MVRTIKSILLQIKKHISHRQVAYLGLPTFIVKNFWTTISVVVAVWTSYKLFTTGTYAQSWFSFSAWKDWIFNNTGSTTLDSSNATSAAQQATEVATQTQQTVSQTGDQEEDITVEAEQQNYEIFARVVKSNVWQITERSGLPLDTLMNNIDLDNTHVFGKIDSTIKLLNKNPDVTIYEFTQRLLDLALRIDLAKTPEEKFAIFNKGFEEASIKEIRTKFILRAALTASIFVIIRNINSCFKS